jgi:hypothetical protein
MDDLARQEAVEQARDGCFLVALVLLVITLGAFILLGPVLLTAVLGALLIAGGLGLLLVGWAAQW